MTCLKCHRNVAKVFAVCVIDCAREAKKKKKKKKPTENYSQTLQYTFYYLWNLTRSRMTTTNNTSTNILYNASLDIV